MRHAYASLPFCFPVNGHSLLTQVGVRKHGLACTCARATRLQNHTYKVFSLCPERELKTLAFSYQPIIYHPLNKQNEK